MAKTSTAAKRPASNVRTTANARKDSTAASRRPRQKKITPEQALAVTQDLLAQKKQHDRETAPWQLLDENAPGSTQRPGFQSDEAAGKNVELHAAESRMKAIQGAMSVRDRRSQGKRDHRDD